MAAKRKIIDREKLELDYRAGIKTFREMAADHGLSAARIKQIADEEGWQRDLAAKIKQVAEAKLNKSILNANLNNEARKASETEVVNASADQVVSVRLSHRTRITKAINIVADLFDELHADSELRLNKADDAKKPLALQTRTAIAKSLTDSLKTVIGLEREAYSIAQSTLVDNPLASLISQLGAGSAFAIVHDDPDEA
jgi:hypothetical protein